MNAISITVNNLPVFKIVCNNYPKTINKYTKYILTEDKLHTNVNDVKKILDDAGIQNYKIITSNEVIQAFEKVVGIDNYILHNWTANWQILSVWFLQKYYGITKLLVLEEDILLGENFDSIFKSNQTALIKSNWAIDKNVDTDKEWVRLTGKHITDCTVWGAPRYHCNPITDENLLASIYESTYFINKFKKTKTWHKSYFDQTCNGQLYYTDDCSRFADVALVMYKLENLDLAKVRNDVKTKNFVHFCCKSKLQILQILQTEGVLNG